MGSLAAAVGRKVISVATAEELGQLARFVLDIERASVVALVIGSGKSARIVPWEALSGFGADAVMVADEGKVRPVGDEHERATAAGKRELVGKRALSDAGNAFGTVTDAEFDDDSGALTTLHVGSDEWPSDSLLAVGSYAAILRASASPGS